MTWAAGDSDAPASLDPTAINAMFREAVPRARDAILQSRTFAGLETTFKLGAIDGHGGVVSTDELQLHLALRHIASFAYMNASARGRELEFYVGWKESWDGVRRATASVGADLMAAGVAMPLDEYFSNAHVCEPIAMLAVLKTVPPKVIIDDLAVNWQSVAVVSPSINGYIYELTLHDCFQRLFACKDVAAIPGLNDSTWAQKFPGKWRLHDGAVRCGKVPSLCERHHACCYTTTFAPPHDNDGPYMAMHVTAAVPPASAPSRNQTATSAGPQAPGAAVVGDVAATASPVGVPTATSCCGDRGKASDEESQLTMLVHIKLGVKYTCKQARSTVLRSNIDTVGKPVGTWQRQKAPELPVLKVVIDPVERVVLDSARAMSSHTEWRGHAEFAWVMDKEYFDGHPDIATVFKHDMVRHLYLCAANRQLCVDGVDHHEQPAEWKASKRAVGTLGTKGGANWLQSSRKRARK